MHKRYAIFIINLLQDVNIVRPLVFMASHDLMLSTQFLVSRKFLQRDKYGIWQRELSDISQATSTPLLTFENEMEALQMLQGKTGTLVAASESNLNAHIDSHDIFRFAPSSFLTVALQHGFECVGFLHNRDHDLAHGREVTFSADVVCSWCDFSKLSSLVPSQRSKIYVTGPPAVLQISRAKKQEPHGKSGLICENLHSVRLNTSGDFKANFLEIFEEFCSVLADGGNSVTLRPHPGGQYMVNNKIPSNVVLNNNPIYKVDLTKFAYGISAPSSILIDMILAGIPVAVWQDEEKIVDVSNYEGLTIVRTLSDWLDFIQEALSHPEIFLERQQRFLENQKMLIEPKDVYERFAGLFKATTKNFSPTPPITSKVERILMVANGYDPTLQLCLLKPLAPSVEYGDMVIECITNVQMVREFQEKIHEQIVLRWIDRVFAQFRPTLVVFCRYSGHHVEYMVELSHKEGIPVIFHIDDNLLNVPKHLGEKKYQAHNNPKRLAAIKYLLDNSDLVYCSTNPLKLQFQSMGAKAPLVSGKINCSGNILVPATKKKTRKIGYMGFDKSHELEKILPILIKFLRNNKNIEFQLLGQFSIPEELNEFENRISLFPTIRNYDEFLNKLAQLDWDIGICPLMKTPFNLLKSNNKWVEYTSVGAAVIASNIEVYSECCADGCGILVETPEDWLIALEKLTHDSDERFSQVSRAQKKLIEKYSEKKAHEQVLDIFKKGKSLFFNRQLT